MTEKTVTLTFSLEEAAILAALAKKGLDMAEFVMKDEDAPPEARIGALAAALRGGKVFNRLVDALPDPEGEEEQEQSSSVMVMPLSVAAQMLH